MSENKNIVWSGIHFSALVKVDPEPWWLHESARGGRYHWSKTRTCNSGRRQKHRKLRRDRGEQEAHIAARKRWELLQMSPSEQTVRDLVAEGSIFFEDKHGPEQKYFTRKLLILMY